MRLRSRQNQNQRCAICHDGSSGLVICRGCDTYVHAQCLLQHGSCPTPGCDEKDPMQESPWSIRRWLGDRRKKRGSDSCVVHGEMSEECRRDLRMLWGHNCCTCELDTEYTAIRRAETGPKEEAQRSRQKQGFCDSGKYGVVPKFPTTEEEFRAWEAESAQRRREIAAENPRLRLFFFVLFFSLAAALLSFVIYV